MDYIKRQKALYYFKFVLFSFIFVIIAIFFMHFSPKINNDIANIEAAFCDEVIYIVIDAGHGGEDGGAISDNGIVEKDLNLDIALKLDKLISMTEYKSVLVRSTDRLMYEQGQEAHKKASDISNRIRIAKSYENCVFISIHQNKFPIKKYSGLQVYFSKNNAQSEILGNMIQNNSKEYLQKDNKRQAKKADKNIRILDSIDCTAVLVECGFLSNSQEAELLNTDSYRNKLAYVMYFTLIEYLQDNKGGCQIEK